MKDEECAGYAKHKTDGNFYFKKVWNNAKIQFNIRVSLKMFNKTSELTIRDTFFFAFCFTFVVCRVHIRIQSDKWTASNKPL